MERIFLIMTGISLMGFITGLAGRSISVNKGSLKKSELFNWITIISLILMFGFAVLYKMV
ncbi:MAG: hypothetical protein K8R53_10265 [Bacteroidales bacterium]|nr:hypothetical protein [Bacteroidales bacterium]